MTDNKTTKATSVGGFFEEFRESILENKMIMAVACSTAAARTSPFSSFPYPTQLPTLGAAQGRAGQLRGYYRRSDGLDYWKPSWSTFGHPRNGNTHQGVDIYARVGTDVVAVVDGYAVMYPTVAPGDELGIKIGITFTASDGQKWDLLYGHLSAVVGKDRVVKKGDLIGKTGCTGNADDGACSTANVCGGYSNHVHIAVKESKPGGSYCDPAAFFSWTLDYEQDARNVPCNQA